MVSGCLQGLKVLGWDAGRGRQVVGVELVVADVGHPHRGAVGPEARRVFVAGGGQGVEVPARVPRLGRQVVGVDLVGSGVGHP